MVTSVFLVIIIAFSVYCFFDPSKLNKYLFHPYSIHHHKEHYRFLTHAFVHGGVMHLGLNVFVLYGFGYALEEAYYLIDGNPVGLYPRLFIKDLNDPEDIERGMKLGRLAYIGLFTGGIYAASITEYFRYKNNPTYSSLGASGAINAVLFSYILIQPTAKLQLFFIPVGIPAWLLGVIFLSVSYYMSKKKESDPAADNIGHEAHFWGAIFGVLYTLALEPSLYMKFFKAIFH